MYRRQIVTMIWIVAFGLLSACSAPTPPTATPAPEGIRPIEPPLALKDFTLTNTQNAPSGLKDWKGKLNLVTFGYTHCPDVCPITLANFKQIRQLLAADASKVNFVFVSVDGLRDTPDVLAKHLKVFDDSFTGLTGPEDAIRVLTNQVGVVYRLDKTTPDQADYTITHTASSFMIDAQGRLRRIYSYGIKPETVVTDIQTLLAEK